jgi:ABC-type nitrate/sulfonate/bicarbonate transport system permease component
MKLTRHFLAVSIVVGLVVALGFVWSTSGAASVVADDGGGRRGAGGFSLSDVSDLVQTLIILALITAVVVTIDRTRRRRRHRQFPGQRQRTNT